MSAVLPPRAVWRAVPQAVALCAWRVSEQRAIAALLAEALGAWRLEWDLPAPAADIVCTAAAEAHLVPATAWEQLGGSPGEAAWLCWDNEQEARSAHAWFGASEMGPVVATVISACRQDALGRIRTALRLTASAQATEPDSAACAPWSGAVVAHLPGFGHVLMEAGAVLALAGRGRRQQPGAPAADLVSLREALRHVRVRLQVELEGCDLHMGALQDLQIGDVLTLRHRIEMPALVSQPSGRAFLSGWLARTRGRRAVELGAVEPTS